MIYFKDDDIKIRDVSEEDINSLFSWSIDKTLNEHDPRPLPKNSKELLQECGSFCEKFDIEIINGDVNKRKYIYFIIADNQDNPIGFVNFFSIDKEKKQGEMGVILGDKRYWGKGIAKKAVSMVVNYIFRDLNINRIYIETGENNKAALKLFEKLKFVKCDEYIEDDNFKFIVMEKIKE
ncbi:GNAT family N-acetyltransferase [Clostridium sp. D2Q-11]|uniref:GNAT family N-acetyltransferase n=1 Tax=Anaeromonas frigoriresistens TaxID=2683708 RepID=A0A942UPS2_9FIRM|nr:GNAT family N-acetyltransferase [Anaeromonas frigoriresistens]MBS4537044.1 GNAT family N-acetyltransferase [Anaeromonas frigoriresistens]